ncbi:MAG: hypothetical protein NC938_04770 [Candidatus Omnitrophica bacterium]|nr:hypothetical protein [Candidatus Omnitrophota bacterium]
MTVLGTKTRTHPTDTELASFLSNSLSAKKLRVVEIHIASCADCLAKVVSAHDAVNALRVDGFPKNERKKTMKKINPYLILAVIFFILSFVIPRYFLQLLAATIILGIKWVVDSKSAKMLVMIYEAWKSGGEREASRILETLDTRSKHRF